MQTDTEDIERWRFVRKVPWILCLHSDLNTQPIHHNIYLKFKSSLSLSLSLFCVFVCYAKWTDWLTDWLSVLPLSCTWFNPWVRRKDMDAWYKEVKWSIFHVGMGITIQENMLFSMLPFVRSQRLRSIIMFTMDSITLIGDPKKQDWQYFSDITMLGTNFIHVCVQALQIIVDNHVE